MHGYGYSAAPVLENEPFQHGVVEAPATVDPVHGAAVHERHEPASAEAEGEVGALQAGIVLPEVEIVRGRVVAAPVGQGTNGQLRPSHEGGALVEGAVVGDHKAVGQLHHADPHGRLLHREAMPEGLLPKKEDRLGEPRLGAGEAAAVAMRPRLGENRREQDRAEPRWVDAGSQERIEHLREAPVVLPREVAARLERDEVADLPDVGHDGGEAATARDEGAVAVVNLRGAIKSDLGRGEPQRKSSVTTGRVRRVALVTRLKENFTPARFAAVWRHRAISLSR